MIGIPKPASAAEEAKRQVRTDPSSETASNGTDGLTACALSLDFDATRRPLLAHSGGRSELTYALRDDRLQPLSRAFVRLEHGSLAAALVATAALIPVFALFALLIFPFAFEALALSRIVLC